MSCSLIRLTCDIWVMFCFDMCTTLVLGVCWILGVGLALVERCTYARAFPVTFPHIQPFENYSRIPTDCISRRKESKVNFTVFPNIEVEPPYGIHFLSLKVHKGPFPVMSFRSDFTVFTRGSKRNPFRTGGAKRIPFRPAPERRYAS